MHIPIRYPILVGILAAALWLFQGALPLIGEDAHQTSCLTRMRELATAIHHYAADNNDELPLVADRSKHPWRWWYNAIFPYTPSLASFYCPELLKQQNAAMRSPLLPVTWNLEFLSYGMTHPLDAYQQKNGNLRLSDITEPDEKIMLGESNFAILRNTPQFWKEDLAPRHFGHANFVTYSGTGYSEGNLPGEHPVDSGSGVHNRVKWLVP